MKELPDSMMKVLRQRRGLKEDDTSQDGKILKMAPSTIVNECVAWELGDATWANFVANLIREAGAKVEDF